MDPENQNTIFTYDEINQIAKFIIFNKTRERENIIMPRVVLPSVYLRTEDEKRVSAIFESCPFKAALSCGAGNFEIEIIFLFMKHINIVFLIKNSLLESILMKYSFRFCSWRRYRFICS